MYELRNLMVGLLTMAMLCGNMLCVDAEETLVVKPEVKALKIPM